MDALNEMNRALFEVRTDNELNIPEIYDIWENTDVTVRSSKLYVIKAKIINALTNIIILYTSPQKDKDELERKYRNEYEGYLKELDEELKAYTDLELMYMKDDNTPKNSIWRQIGSKISTADNELQQLYGIMQEDEYVKDHPEEFTKVIDYIGDFSSRLFDVLSIED